MPTLTPSFSLPYPNALDRPCDFAEQWCDFSDAFQTVLDGFQATVDRTNPAIPMARMVRTTPQSIVPFDRVEFDALTVNTANWVDFDASSSTVIINRGGIFVVIANAETTAVTGAAEYHLSVTVQGVTSNSFSDQQDVNTVGMPVGLNTTSLVAVSVPTTLNMTVFTDTLVTVSVSRAALSVFWHADRSTP